MTETDAKALQTVQAYRQKLTRQQFKTLRGQCLAGNGAGAMKGLQKSIGWKD